MKSLSKGKYLVDSKKKYQIKPKGKLLDKAKIAIITGTVTASSGEIVAIAFKGRPNTIFIGEESLGFTSENYLSNLPFGTIMTLTRTYNSDRNGNYYERIIPEIPVLKQDNFDNFLLDGKIQEAIKFISKKNNYAQQKKQCLNQSQIETLCSLAQRIVLRKFSFLNTFICGFKIFSLSYVVTVCNSCIKFMLKMELVQTDKHSIKILLRRKNLRFLRRTNYIQIRHTI